MSRLISALLFFGLLAPAAWAQIPPLSVRADAPVVRAGDALTVSVQLGTDALPVSGVAGVGVQLHFDPAVFRAESVTDGPFVSGRIDDGEALPFARIVTPDEDLDGDGAPDGLSYAAYSVTVVRPNTPLDGAGAVATVALTTLDTAPVGPSALALESVDVLDPNGAEVAVVPVGASVEVSTVERVRRAVASAGDPPALVFPDLDGLRLDFAGLDADADVLAGRSLLDPGGPYPVIDGEEGAPAVEGFWSAEQTGATPPFDVTVCVPLTEVRDEVQDPSILRMLRRATAADPWTVLPTTLEPAAAPVRVCGTASSLSEFVVAGPQSRIPVELVRFGGAWSAGGVVLTWATASETNNAGFGVERADGPERAATFRPLGFVEGAGTVDAMRTYRFVDRAVPFGVDAVRYRLRQVDHDGTETLSDAVTIRVRTDALLLHAPVPSPAHTTAEVRYETPRAGAVRLALFDVLGRRVRLLADAPHRAGRHRATVDASTLPAGLYLLRLTHDGAVRTTRLYVVR